MYFNENKEDTNIDDEFKKERSFDFSKYKIPLIIIGAIILLLIIILLISSASRNKTKYFVTLEGTEEMTVYKGATYNEPGYKGYDNKGKTYDVKIDGKVNTSTIGTYTITYSLHNTTKTRTVKVVEPPKVPTILHLKGDKNITLKVGDKYEEPGYNAVDYIDGDITDKVKITGKVNTSNPGVYRLVYSVVNSDGVTTSESRVITVK